MPEPGILRLDEYRERREQRLRLAASLYRADPARSDLLGHLARVATLLGADRAATVWIDEYGPGLVHPHVVLDLLSDRPRRSFSADPLRRAWEAGVPGLFESHGTGLATPRGETPPWTVAVALGSDGTRSWFLVADAVSAGRSLDDNVRDRVMFLAGECSAVVLHRDLDKSPASVGSEAARSAPRFAGWPILQDIEGREGDEEESRRIAMRFVVARLPRLLVDDDLASPADRLRQQAERAREEMTKDGEPALVGPEWTLWASVLDAFQEGDLDGLGRALLSLGEAVEARLHLHGAVELYQTAYELFAATGSVVAAVDAARFAGRALRRLARWDEASRWYGVAREVAVAGALPAKVALVLDGSANLHRERGNLPAARALLVDALSFAEESRDDEARGTVYHGLTGLDHQAGRLDDAMVWGWKAVQAYKDRDKQVMALASLGGVLLDAGALSSSADAWACVRDLAANDYYRLYALDALGHIAALRGDAGEFARWAAAADALGWESGTLPVKAEILHYRGLSYRALGNTEQARSYLRRAVAFAEEHGYSQTLFAAEEALKVLDEGAWEVAHPVAPPPTEEIRSGLRGMRRSVEEALPV